jgi:hypothetical protein
MIQNARPDADAQLPRSISTTVGNIAVALANGGSFTRDFTFVSGQPLATVTVALRHHEYDVNGNLSAKPPPPF